MSNEQNTLWFRETYDKIRTEIAKAVVGQEAVVEGVLMGLAANGHVLLEGMPGLGKTLLVRSLSQVLSMSFSRIQFTPDLMPADVTGTSMFREGAFEFRRGPIFAHILLADEINRATPKTQSAMLEAMQERAVTIGGTRHSLEEPFLVMATQNPIEQEGTYPLPEAQLDRFLFKLLVPYPTRAELSEIVTMTTGKDPESLAHVADAETVLKLRQVVRDVPISDNVLQYALSLVLALHPDSDEGSSVARRYVRYGPSPRGAQALVTAGKIKALLAGRFNVSKEDIRAVAAICLRHRFGLNFEAEADGMTTDKVVNDICEFVEKGDRDPISV
ncbi:MAG: MoxR family ATPase [Fimbriimonadaceae bacterium]